VAAVVRRDNRFLMLQRGGGSLGLISDGKGEWAFPGGWLEHGETAHDAARRECEEETGVMVNPTQSDGFVITHSPSGFTVVTLFVWCHHIYGDPVNKEPEKALAVQWMDEGLFTELDLFAPADQWWRRGR
jgi:8-oxo-dGTP diphosphatase